MLESMWREIRLSARALRRSPGFALAAVVTLAVGIGATTAVFSVVYSVLVRPLPFPGADRLVRIVQVLESREPGQEPTRAGLSPNQFVELTERATSFSAIGTYGHAAATLTGIGTSARVLGAGIAPGLFAGLGVAPLLGRALEPADGESGADPVVVLGHGAWIQYFGGDRAVVGSRIVLDGTPTRVVGVMPAGFGFPSLAGPYMTRNTAGDFEDAPEYWTPMKPMTRMPETNGFSIFQAFAVLRPGVARERAEAEVRSLTPPLNGQRLPVHLVPARSEMTRPVRRVLLLFQGGVALLLLIACVNVVNLLLARATGRRGELGIRVALGVSGGRLVREGLAEALLLSLAGGVLGCLLAYGMVAVMRTLPPNVLPRLHEIRVDGVVLAFAAALSIACGLAVGLFTGLRVLRSAPRASLRAAGDASAGFVLARPSSLLVVAEVAMAMMLVTSAGLLVHSVVRLATIDPGYEPQGLVSFRVSLPAARYADRDAQLRLYRDLAARLDAEPGVDSVAATNASLTATGAAIGFWPLTIDGATTDEAHVIYRQVSPAYFATLDAPLVHGRELRDADLGPKATSVVVNEAFAREFFGTTNAVGRRFSYWEWPSLDVVGVVRDIRPTLDSQQPGPTMFLPPDTVVGLRQLTVVVRTSLAPPAVSAAARAALRAVDPQLALYDAAPVDELLQMGSASPRLYGFVSMFSAVTGLGLAAIGLYGLLSYVVSLRTREFGIRIALGAERGPLVRGVVRQGLSVAGAGLVIGLAGAMWVARSLEALLFGITPQDGATFATVTAVFLTAAVAACYVPSRRATRVDPVIALRAE